MKNYFRNKKILVTGGTGLIGTPLARKLKEMEAEVRIVSLDEESIAGDKFEFMKGDLCDKRVCAEAVRGAEIVFHLAGIKGGIGVAKSKASSFLVKNILMDIQIMEAARIAGVKQFLYASSICVYPPAEIFLEENAGKGLPHPSDKFGGMAKLIGEMQIEAYKLQYKLENFLIARPVNTYGPYDNFNSVSALVIPSLILRIFSGEDPLVVWGDGSAVRDFIFSEDVADFLLLMVFKNAAGPYNVGSGKPVSIRDLTNTILNCAEKFVGKKINIQWDATKEAGEKYRVASIEKAKNELGWMPKVALDSGILETLKWYQQYKSALPRRYSILSEGQ